MARTLELDTITEPSNTGTANITLSSNTTTTMPLVDINGGAIDGTTLGVATPSSVAATTITASGATTLNGDVTLGNASSDTVTVTGTMAGINNKSGMTGEVRMWAGSSAPTGWLFCDGAAVSRSTYSALFGITSTAFGIGDGSSTFNVPDMKGRMPVGVGTGTGGGAEDADGSTVPSGGAALVARSLGEWSGAEVLLTAQLAAHTHTMKNHTHAMKNHTHTWSDTSDGPSNNTTGSGSNHTHNLSSHTHTYNNSMAGSYQVASDAALGHSGTGTTYEFGTTGTATGGPSNNNTSGESSHTHSMQSHTHAVSGTTAAPNDNVSNTPNDNTSDSTGSGSKFTPPIMCINFIIKT